MIWMKAIYLTSHEGLLQYLTCMEFSNSITMSSGSHRELESKQKHLFKAKIMVFNSSHFTANRIPRASLFLYKYI